MPSRSFLGSIVGAFGDIHRAGRASATYHGLAMMSDDELARRGMSRSDLPRIAYKAGFGDL